MGVSELYVLNQIRESIEVIKTFLIYKEVHEVGLIDDETWAKAVEKIVAAMTAGLVDNEEKNETRSEKD